MSEAEAVNETLVDTDLTTLDRPGEASGQEEQLDEVATSLLHDIEGSQLEVQRMLEDQRLQAEELGSMKEHLCTELQQLRDDAWRFHMNVELEMLKRQLAILSNLDADLDDMEARLDSEQGEPDEEIMRKMLEDARAATLAMLTRKPESSVATNGNCAGPSKSAGGGDEDADAEIDPEVDAAETEDEDFDVSALQQRLDEDLRIMHEQLQAVKAESAVVAARKAQLEAELRQLMEEKADDLSAQLRDLGFGDDQSLDGYLEEIRGPADAGNGPEGSDNADEKSGASEDVDAAAADVVVAAPQEATAGETASPPP
ncbi:hypothetical protein Vretimale_14442 [Volvox reticuliferus]|uniref:Uncharacterized protein n=1 Tax=Volvox reticuliferus TaxID=1737510 RepID=A0A8J4FUG1_9CHLO|nr:hypothetical protein Vretifemale_13221 [Volvox reticuliferus]GIM10827.1 hypothetical protein Vretimale_14442 [Volvox reticuliferus]